MSGNQFNRRQMLAGGLGALTTVAAAKTKLLRARGHDLVKRAASTPAAGSDMGAVEHVVFLMHENRSFDHYYGTMQGVNGFGSFDPSSPVWAQAWPGGVDSTVWPFHLDPATQEAECTYDLSHTWQAEHSSWNGGAMDSFVSTHTSAAYEGPGYGTLTMGYYEAADIPFYWDLVQNFTICDNYFCSVLGPTHPNRLMQMTGTIDPAGLHGGPILVTNSEKKYEFTCSWVTMPEVLSEHGISWKVYNPPGFQYQPGHDDSMLLCKNVLMYMEQYKRNAKLRRQAFHNVGPNVDFDLFGGQGADNLARDVARDKLPAVSWIIPPDGYDEHPPAPTALGEWYTAKILSTLMSNPKVWARTVVFIMYDENDGWFDHVAPLTAPPGTPGEYVTKSPLPSDAGGIAGPIGLGVRVPMIVVSPFSVGGYVCSEMFDHTSQLQFLKECFDLPSGSIPNVSSWRLNNVGDLTAALPLLNSPNTRAGIPFMPAQSLSSFPVSECSGIQITEANPPYPIPPIGVPAVQVAPVQVPTDLQPVPG